ncbi:MAG: cation transporter [Proteobacteria bacterium]|nr:cation transporter [Pseudomonadota bacterium]
MGRHGHAGHHHDAHDEHAGRAHRHDHDHDHDHAAAGSRALAIALVLTAGFAVVEAIGGWIGGSLALLSDAGHMVADAGALGLALFAQRIARRPPSARASYGYARAEVLAAFVNALAMLLIVAFIVIEAVRRLASPEPVQGVLVAGIATAGLGVNVVAAWVLSRGGGSMNLHAAWLHVVSDALGSIAAIIAGVVIAWTGWLPIDPLLSIAISLLILRSTWRLLRRTTAVLMEGVPTHLDFEAIGVALAALPHVTGVHDLHVWHMGSEEVALSAHVNVGTGADWPGVLAAAQRLLRERYGIVHVTLQPAWPLPQREGARVIPLTPAK